MEQIITTTLKGTSGINISYLNEINCGKSLLKILPKGWKIKFTWRQSLFSDVQYKIDEKKKIISIAYNQNLSYWWKDLQKDLQKEIKAKILNN